MTTKNLPAIITDRYGNKYSPVCMLELGDWAWLLGHLEDWLLHAHEDTISDYEEHFAPCGPKLEYVISTLGNMSVRMRKLAAQDRGQD